MSPGCHHVSAASFDDSSSHHAYFLSCAQVMTLVMGRVFVLLGCSEPFARMALPVLMDGVVSGHSNQPAATYACLTKTMAGGRRE